MWYTGTDTNGSGQNTIGYATSSDGETWAKQGQVLGNGPNSEDFDDFHTESGNVIKDGDVYKMFYAGYNQTTAIYAIGYALSTDGENWIKKGTILEKSDDGGWDSSVYGASVIKDGKSYKMWYSSSSTRNVMGYAVLAMTHYYNPIAPPYNTEERTLGTYINDEPQVNFGYKSLDSVVVNYERMAVQQYQKTGFTIDKMELKKSFLTNLGTNTGSDSGLLKYAMWFAPSYDRYLPTREFHQSDVNVESIVANMLTNKLEYSEYSDIAYFDPKDIFPVTIFRNITEGGGGTNDVVNGLNKDQEGFGDTIALYTDLLAKYPSLASGYTTGDRGVKVGNFSTIKTDGQLLFGFNMEHESQGTRLLAYFVGVQNFMTPMIGRPLIK
jgi:hypothetical protein